DRMSGEIIRFPPPPVPAGVEDDAARRMELLGEREKVIASDGSGFDGAWERKDGGRAGAEVERGWVGRVAVAAAVGRPAQVRRGMKGRSRRARVAEAAGPLGRTGRRIEGLDPDRGTAGEGRSRRVDRMAQIDDDRVGVSTHPSHLRAW